MLWLKMWWKVLKGFEDNMLLRIVLLILTRIDWLEEIPIANLLTGCVATGGIPV